MLTKQQERQKRLALKRVVPSKAHKSLNRAQQIDTLRFACSQLTLLGTVYEANGDSVHHEVGTQLNRIERALFAVLRGLRQPQKRKGVR